MQPHHQTPLLSIIGCGWQYETMSIIRISKSTYLSPGILTCFRKCSRKLNCSVEVSLSSYTVTEAYEPKSRANVVSLFTGCLDAKDNPVINTANKSFNFKMIPFGYFCFRTIYIIELNWQCDNNKSWLLFLSQRSHECGLFSILALVMCGMFQWFLMISRQCITYGLHCTKYKMMQIALRKGKSYDSYNRWHVFQAILIHNCLCP